MLPFSRYSLISFTAITAQLSSDSSVEAQKYYVVEYEGERVLHGAYDNTSGVIHKNKEWHYVSFPTGCCGKIVADLDDVTPYSEKPDEKCYDTICPEMQKDIEAILNGANIDDVHAMGEVIDLRKDYTFGR